MPAHNKIILDDPIQDALSRPLHDLRISVTDRCNFRCGYCMPKEVFGRDHQFLKRAALLNFEEIERIARAFVLLGVRKIRLTGGEPLIRQDLEFLIRKLKAIDHLEDLSLTTNASLLTAKRAASLKEAGIHRINVSLDAIDEETFGKVNSVNFPVQKVLKGIDRLIDAEFPIIKINMVVQRGLNEHSIIPMVDYFRELQSKTSSSRIILRFIEFMDVGNANDWHLDDVFSSQKIHELIDAKYPLETVDANYKGEVAQRWQYKDGGGELGIISSITQPFCNDCSRARLSAIGEVYHCLFASEGLPLLEKIRGGISDKSLLELIKAAWLQRSDQYSMVRFTSPQASQNKVEMSYIGG